MVQNMKLAIWQQSVLIAVRLRVHLYIHWVLLLCLARALRDITMILRIYPAYT